MRETLLHDLTAAARAYVARFDGCKEADLSPPLRDLVRAIAAYDSVQPKRAGAATS